MKSVSWKEPLEQFNWLCIWITRLLKSIKGHTPLSAVSSAFLPTALSLPSHPILDVFLVAALAGAAAFSVSFYLENADHFCSVKIERFH